MKKYTFKQKIDILNVILNDYSKYFKYFDKCICYFPVIRIALTHEYLNDKKAFLAEDDYYLRKPFKIKQPTICVYFSDKNRGIYSSLKRHIPVKDIDKIIARYRSKRDYEINKFIEKCMSKRVCHNLKTIPDRLQNVKFY